MTNEAGIFTWKSAEGIWVAQFTGNHPQVQTTGYGTSESAAIANLKSTLKEYPTLSWDEATAAMKAEGYAWFIRRGSSETDSARAWFIGKLGGDGYASSSLDDPTEALNDLLQKCRARWPKAEPWDAMSLEEILAECLSPGKATRVTLYPEGDATSGDKRFCVNLNGLNGYGDDTRSALIDAMRRLKANRTRP